MIIKHKLNMELDRRDGIKQIDVMQDDKYSRELELYLRANGEAYCPPEGCMVLVRYIKPDGQAGAYDTMPDGSKAWKIHNNVVSVGLVPQVCTAAGLVMLTVTMRHLEKELSCFTIYVNVQKGPGSDIESEPYCHVNGFIPQPDSATEGEYIKVVSVDEKGNITAVTTSKEVAKSAYQYALESGYTGTEAEFAEKLASESTGIHIGAEAPTDEDMELWIDTDEEDGGIAVTAEVGQTIIVEEVDADGKPIKWKAADYQPRTHYKRLVEIANCTAVDEGGGMLIASSTPLVIGNTYLVTYNGEEHSCTAFECDFSGDGSVLLPAIGNPAMFDYDGTGAPFVILDGIALGAGGYIIVDLTFAEEATVRIVGEGVIPIPTEYMTNAFPYYINVYCDDIVSPTAYTCMETVADVEAVLNSGRPIAVKYSTQDAITVMYQILSLVRVYPTDPNYGSMLSFMCNGDILGGKGGSTWIVLNPQEDGTYLVTTDTFGG